jgi:alkylation response protein AidB-like acyl-CoA dehydrogenase
LLDPGRLSAALASEPQQGQHWNMHLITLKKRRAFGMELVSFQAIQFKLAEMHQKVETFRLLTWKAAWESDQHQDVSH